jgi:transposase
VISDSRSKTEAVLSRRTLSDAHWARIENLVPGKSTDRGRSGVDNRLFVDAVLWMARSCAPWRDLPPGFGEWNSIFRRFRRWAQRDVFKRIFEAVSDDPDFEYVMIDGTIVSAHQKASGAKGGLSIRPLGAQKAD